MNVEAFESIHLAIDIATPVVIAAATWVGLVIKNTLSEMKLEQSVAMAALQKDFDRKHAENTLAIAVHTTSDDQKFLGINGSLARIERKLDRINGHV